MKRVFNLLCLAASACVPVAAQADERAIFVGLDLSGGIAGGSSNTTDGGAPFAGGGVVEDVDFGNSFGIGGHIGYRLSPQTSLFLSYQHVKGDVSWRADFPLYGVQSDYAGSAVGDAVMANMAYAFPLSEKVALRASAGAGVSFNRLKDIVETDVASGIFVSDVAARSKAQPIGRVGAGLDYALAPSVSLGLDAAFSYSGGFETGNTRSGNLGITDINPYKIDEVWRGSLGASLRVAF